MATSKTRKRFSWLISLIVMLAASAALIFASDRVTAAVYGPYQESQPVPTVASMTEMDISGYAAEDYQVEMVQTCLDESGAVVGLSLIHILSPTHPKTRLSRRFLTVSAWALALP